MLRAAAIRSLKPSLPAERRNVSGSWPAGRSATFTLSVPAPSNAPARGLEELLGPRGGFLPGRVGIEERDDLVAVAPEQGELGRSERGAERRHGPREPVLVSHDAVDVA